MTGLRDIPRVCEETRPRVKRFFITNDFLSRISLCSFCASISSLDKQKNNGIIIKRINTFFCFLLGSHEAPAFLQCGAWMFPMVPGRSPVLNTEPHTYMFPDITIDPSSPISSNPRPQRAFASVGLILNPNISSMELQRFERILKCYTDFHHYTPPKDFEEESVGVPAQVDQRRDDDRSAGVTSMAEFTDETGSSMAVAVRPRSDVEPADSQVPVHCIVPSKGISL